MNLKWNKILTKSFLKKEYLKNKKSQEQIGEKINCSQSVVCKYLKIYNIPTRKRILKKYYCKNCGKKVCRKIIKKCGSCSQKYKFLKYPNLKKKISRLGTKHTYYTKRKISKASKGKNNCNYGKKHPGLNAGENNPMYGRLSPHSPKIKYKGIWMRSSWEVAYAKWLDKNEIGWKYEFKTFDLGNTTYTPDFYLPTLDLWIEIKGWWRPNNKKKYKILQKQQPKINIQLLMNKELKDMGVL